MNLHDIAPEARVWLAGNGLSIPIPTLEEDHIRNIIRYPWNELRLTTQRRAMLAAVFKEARRRGITV